MIPLEKSPITEWKHAAGEQWDDWQWQMRNRLLTAGGLRAFTALTEAENEALNAHSLQPPLSITPYYLDVILSNGADHPLRKTMIPAFSEHHSSDELLDPLGEETHKVTDALIHTYPDKALLLVHDQCPAYCRYCTRKRRAGKKSAASTKEITDALNYLRGHPEIRDVLISGGEPLLLKSKQLDELLSALRTIPHIEIIRIGTKAPMTLPQRITTSLCNVLKKHQPIWISMHCTHPDEWTPASKKAVARLVDAGVPCVSQTVLLKGVNADADTIRTLMQTLLYNRVKPYYLFLPDMVQGIDRFRIPVEDALEIIRQLHGFTSGLAVPSLMIDAPGGGGKIPLLPDYVISHKRGLWALKNYHGETYHYPDPACAVR